jgi:hypothetical protein
VHDGALVGAADINQDQALCNTGVPLSNPISGRRSPIYAVNCGTGLVRGAANAPRASSSTGTYVKASTESHADAGDKNSDGTRVNGNELRCKVVGEGGNLGLTQRGRIEFARSGGRINTDAIDNQNGVGLSRTLLPPPDATGVPITVDVHLADGNILLDRR